MRRSIHEGKAGWWVLWHDGFTNYYISFHEESRSTLLGISHCVDVFCSREAAFDEAIMRLKDRVAQLKENIMRLRRLRKKP